MNTSKIYALLVPVVSVLIALLIASIIIIMIGKNPITAYSIMLEGAFGSQEAVADTIMKMTPLILTGLAVGFGFRAGVFNIGAEGQMTMGALIGAIVAMNIGGIPSVIAIPLSILVGMLAGAFWASIAGFLKAFTGAHEVISTIMLNWIAANIASFMVSGPLAVGSGTPKSPEIAEAAKLPVILKVQATELSIGIFIAIAVAIIMYILIEKTTTGYKLKAVGFNPHAAEYGGISIRKSIILTMAISGALAGMAGIVDLIGVPPHRFVGELTGGRGFDGITIALIGRNHPIGIIFAALLIAALRTGSNAMQIRAQIPNDIVSIIQGIVIFLVAAERIVSTLISWRRKKGVTAI
ncbi:MULTISPECIES: ABC transporter permease [unclassified Mesotoga]|jgi:simple sugar transport system permease protein|uniref:ABC transporter permease n=1 Tax=unclassified Mesotoga TaxID=1184398 RepID=UPI000EF23562|nr:MULTISPECIES: ABC transporter permease [unclassified Mesotoga]MDD3680310.1 ABC transporter permease [Mesotoga sp.]MDD4206885.1 ABC transporter permease [Mesotoga sp.]MDI9368822.1 ABC transporter permease [Thermotogota bacterium]RLL87213.1 sugar ABC transporter permease [Mesotoga sp. BH458_6_3_2_1]